MATPAQQSTSTNEPIPQASIVVADLTALEALDTSILTFGTFVWVISEEATYQLSSNAGVSEWNEFTGGGGSGITALTGDVTASGTGSVAATVANIPTGATLAAKLTATAVVAPATPAAGKGAIYVDSTSKNLCVKDDAGTIKHGVQSQTTAGLFVQTISDAGVVGTATVAQARALINPVYYVAATGQYLALTGLDGDADGDYDVSGQIVCGHSGATYAFEPNNQTADLKAVVTDVLTGAVAGTAWNWPGRTGANPYGGLAVNNTLTITTGRLTIISGRIRSFQVTGFSDETADNTFTTYGIWTDTATNLTTFRLASNQTDGFAAGSWLRLTALGRS